MASLLLLWVIQGSCNSGSNMLVGDHINSWDKYLMPEHLKTSCWPLAKFSSLLLRCNVWKKYHPYPRHLAQCMCCSWVPLQNTPHITPYLPDTAQQGSVVAESHHKTLHHTYQTQQGRTENQDKSLDSQEKPNISPSRPTYAVGTWKNINCVVKGAADCVMVVVLREAPLWLLPHSCLPPNCVVVMSPHDCIIYVCVWPLLLYYWLCSNIIRQFCCDDIVGLVQKRCNSWALIQYKDIILPV